MKTIEVKLERFEETDLETKLKKQFGPQSDREKLYGDILRTYTKYLWKEATTDITIITDEVDEQVYKVMAYEIKIKNKFK